MKAYKNGKFGVRFLHKNITKVLIFVVFFVAILFILFYKFASGTTRAEMNIDVPSPAHFVDDISAVVSQNIPEINNHREINAPSDLIIWYRNVSEQYVPTFRDDLTNENLATYADITPNIRGKWVISSSDTIKFVPNEDWMPDTTYTVKLKDDIFNPETKVDSRNTKFKIPPVSANIDSFNVYPTKDASQSVVGVAIVSFSNPIQTNEFAEKLSLFLNGKRVQYDVNFDKYSRTARIKTAPIKITDSNQTLRMKLNRVRATIGKSRTAKITASANIASMDNFFKISDLTTIVAENKHGNSQQLILLNTTTPILQPVAKQHIMKTYLLPKYKTLDEEKDDIPHEWANDEITPDVISKSKNIELSSVDFANPAGTYQYAFGYDISDNCDRYIYTEVKSGIKSENGLITKNGLAKVMRVPYPKRSVTIAGTGALLSLAGEKQIGIVARGGVDMAYVNLYKVESTEINHLITQTYDLFSKVDFKNPWNFDAYDMSVVFQKKIPFSDNSMNKVNYAPLNLGEYMDRTYSDKTGIFIIKTSASKDDSEYNDARLIIVTDLGIIRKVNLDKTSVVFVSKLSDGTPVPDTDVTVLARNGRSLWAGVTNSEGYVDIPNFSWQEYKNEKEPIAIIARTDSDLSFIPYNADNAQTAEFSRFDVGGTYYSNTTSMGAFIFSDRGIYRPGERVTIGTIVENRNFTSVGGIPVKLEITNPRGNVIFERKVSLTDDGLFDTEYKLANDSVIGKYEVAVHSLNQRGHIKETLGTANFMVQEFIPDTMKISANLPNVSSDGWGTSTDLITNVTLTNMYGTPATNRRVSATAILRPSDFSFDAYPDYKFAVNSVSNNMSKSFAKSIQTVTLQIPDVRTDENGNAVLTLDSDTDIPMGTYLLNMQINGFESGDGKSIQTILNSRISNYQYLVGYKTGSDLNYLNKGADIYINLIALDNSGISTDIENIKMRLIKRENQTSLIKDYNNNYKYQTISRDNVIHEYDTTISKGGTDIKLDTNNGGTYFLEIRDNSDNILGSIEYFVAANENADLQTDKNADLRIKLDASEYKPGTEINISITSPYTGSGLITIERDKVYAHKWFFAQTTSSTQTITLPDDFEGTGYVNVSFVRDINSTDIFTTPYTYAVAPFSTNIDKHKVEIKLDVPQTITDNKLNIEYTTDKDAKIMIFAVNTGILQVAKYNIPNPIKHFFQKAALQVETYQILSLLLPEYSVMRQVAKIGGGDYSPENGAFDMPLTNPFSRKNIPSVAFYSGVKNVSADTTETITFDIPEYFNGSLSVYAIAATGGAIGAAKTEARVQSPVVISVSGPSFAAPGDKFKLNTVVSNLTTEQNKGTKAQISAGLSDNLTAGSDTIGNIELPIGTEKLWTMDLIATDKLGNADVELTTNLSNDKDDTIATRNAKAHLSIRPATSMVSEIKFGQTKSSNTTIKIPAADMYPEMQTQTLYLSKHMSVLAYPMIKYLNNYEYSCTEQLVSKTLPYVVVGRNELIGISSEKSSKEISNTIQILAGRQNDDGSFGMWAPDTKSEENITDATTTYVTAYVMNFLTMARKKGINVPQSMYSRGIDFLRSYAGESTTSESDALAKAFAIYVLTVNDFVTTSYIDSLQEYLHQNMKNWENGLIGTYVAAAYKMLKQNDKAQELISKYKKDAKNLNAFDTPVANDAINMFITRKYFDAHPGNMTSNMEKYITAGKYDSFNAAMLVLATSEIDNDSVDNLNPSGISVSIDKEKTQINTDSDFTVARVPLDAKKIHFECPNCKNSPVFYTLVRQGFPRTIRAKSSGLEITRNYYDINGQRINSGNIGDVIEVRITARTRGGTDTANNVVISDLLPCGIAPVSDTLEGNMDFSEIREDRVLIYTKLTREPLTFKYRAQLTVSGEFIVPGITAQDMYNPNINAVNAQDIITVSNNAN